MPGFIRSDYTDRADQGPTPLAPIVPHSCVACVASPPCAGACSRRVCKLHAYQCSRDGCDGVLCEACWTRHEVRGMHVPASPAEVQAALARKRDWPMPHKVHKRTGRFPGARS